MKKFFQAVLALFGKSGLRALVNAIVGTEYFKDVTKGLLVGQISGLREPYPELYTTLTQVADVVSDIPDILTDDNPNNLEQLAVELRLARIQELENLFAKLREVSESVETATRTLRLKV